MYLPAIDAEATTAEKLSQNPRLQQIIHQINTKDSSDSPSPSGSTSSVPTAAASAGGLLGQASPGPLSASSTPPLAPAEPPLHLNGLDSSADSSKFVGLAAVGAASAGDNLLQLTSRPNIVPVTGNQTILQAMAAAGQNGLLPSPPCAAAAAANATLPFTAFNKPNTGLLGLRNSPQAVPADTAATATYFRHQQSAATSPALFGYNGLTAPQQSGQLMIPYTPPPTALPTPGMGYGKLIYPTATTPVFSSSTTVTYPAAGLFPNAGTATVLGGALPQPPTAAAAGAYLGAPGLMLTTTPPATLKRALHTDPYGLGADKRAKYC